MLVVNTKAHVENYFYVLNEDKIEVPLKLWPKQVEAWDILDNYLKAIFLKSRQSGFSTITGAKGLTQCMYQNNFTFLVLSVTGDDSEEYLYRAKTLFNKQPDNIKALFPIKRDNSEELLFENGSRMISLPAHRGYGLTADMVVVDEFFKINRTRSKISIEEVLAHVGPTLDKRKGQLVCVGTADGMNRQRQMYYEAKKGISSYRPLFFSCYDDPTMTEQKRAQKVIDEGEDIINQEYPRTDDEAFLSSGKPRFDMTLIHSYYRPLEPPVIAKGDLDDYDQFILNDKGDTEIYKLFKQFGQYMVVCDVAEGLRDGDFSVGKVYDLETWEQVAQWHGHIEPAAFGSVVTIMARHWNNAVIVVEHNNHGGTTLATIRHYEEYPEHLIYQTNFTKEKADDDFKHPEKRFGWYTTPKTRPIIINNLAQLIRDKEIPYFNSNDITELGTFVKKPNGKSEADSGCFDDCVMTNAIAYYVIDRIDIINVKAKRLPVDNCVNCRHYDRHNKACSLTKRLIKDKNETWCSQYDKDMSSYIVPDNVAGKKRRYQGIVR